MTGDTRDRRDGPTPRGGAYSIVYWKGPDGEPVSRDEAVAGEIVEFDANDVAIARTYFEMKDHGKQG